MTNTTLPIEYKNEIKKTVIISRYFINSAVSIVLPGVVTAEATSVGVVSFVRKSTESCSIYTGNPVIRLKSRNKNFLDLHKEYLNEMNR